MERLKQEVVIWDAVTPQTVTSSTDATPIVVTKASHGFSSGDVIQINGHTTNIAANGIYKITVLSANTFSLQHRVTGLDVAGSGAGAGSGGVMVKAPKILLMNDARNVIFSVETSNSANFTFKVAGSIGRCPSDVTGNHTDTPNFGITQSKTEPYTYVQIIDLDTAAAVNGATGVTTAGTDLHKMYEVNVNGLKYLGLVLTAWSAGTITVKAILFNNL